MPLDIVPACRLYRQQHGYGLFPESEWFVQDVCEDRRQLVTTGFQTEVWDAIWAWGLPGLFSLKEMQDILITGAACRLHGKSGVWWEIIWVWFYNEWVEARKMWKLCFMEGILSLAFLSANFLFTVAELILGLRKLPDFGCKTVFIAVLKQILVFDPSALTSYYQ